MKKVLILSAALATVGFACAEDSSCDSAGGCGFYVGGGLLFSDSGEKMELAFHIRYFTEIIENIGTERVCIRFDEQKSAAVFLPAPEQDYYFFLAQRKRG